MENRKVRYLSEIRTVAELREARRELEIREWFASERLGEDIRDTFSLNTLLSIVAPSGGMVDRMIGNVGTGFMATRGIVGAIGSLFGGRMSSCGRTATRTVGHHSAGHASTTHHSGGHSSVAHSSSGHSSSHAAHHASEPHLRSGEIEVELELEPKRPAARAKSPVRAKSTTRAKSPAVAKSTK